ncbi:MAG: 2-dehydropantoate 2-reductase [Deltaproteobacteria bacterium]|nr:2-dehydropantoate 2-reductase [Deltaproteobacteria bacterium]
MSTRVLVVGCGGIGGVLGASLAQMHDIDESLLARPTILARNAALAAHVRERGLRVLGASEALGRPEIATSTGALSGGYDLIFLATQPPQVEAAAAEVAPLLAKDGALVCFQNGLCEERVAAAHGGDQVLGAVVSWGASVREPGVIERTSAGGFTLGRLDGGTADPRLVTLQALLSSVGPAELTPNLRGARWSKLAINAAISSLGTVGGDRLGALMRHRFIRRLALEIMSEVVAVAEAEGVRLEKVSGTLDLPWLALTDAERAGKSPGGLVAKHAVLLAVGTRYRKLRSSMLSAIERGREPAVDFLNGEVADRGARHGIATPVNTATRQLVHAVARGEQQSSLSTARTLMDAIS